MEKKYLQPNNHSTTKLIGLCGVSASGKSTLTKTLEAQGVGKRFRFDAYYKDEVDCPRLNGVCNWDVPESLYLDQVYHDLVALKEGKSIELPVYKRSPVSARVGFTPFGPTPVLLAEGIFLFTDARIRALFDQKMWVDLPEEDVLRRRRERQPDYDLVYHRTCMWPGMERYVLPYKDQCDVVLDARQSPEALALEAKTWISSKL